MILQELLRGRRWKGTPHEGDKQEACEYVERSKKARAINSKLPFAFMLYFSQMLPAEPPPVSSRPLVALLARAAWWCGAAHLVNALLVPIVEHPQALLQEGHTFVLQRTRGHTDEDTPQQSRAFRKARPALTKT